MDMENEICEGGICEICEGECEEGTCPIVAYQDVGVSVPVTIRPFAEVGDVQVDCLGKPMVKENCDDCPGKPGKVCRFTVSQKLRVVIPIVFGAETEICEPCVDCGCAKSNFICGKGM